MKNLLDISWGLVPCKRKNNLCCNRHSPRSPRSSRSFKYWYISLVNIQFMYSVFVVTSTNFFPPRPDYENDQKMGKNGILLPTLCFYFFNLCEFPYSLSNLCANLRPFIISIRLIPNPILRFSLGGICSIIGVSCACVKSIECF